MQYYGGRFVMYACVCVRACVHERGGMGEDLFGVTHNPLLWQLVWACISLVLLLFSSLVMISIFYFNIIDDGWGRTQARLNSPVATNVKPAFIRKFIHGSL